MLFLLIKIFHIVSTFTWMAGIFYLPRLFVYHTTGLNNNQLNETFKIMEYKLYKYIMVPSMICAVSSGIFMFIYYGFYQNYLMHLKLLLVLLLVIYNFYLGHIINLFKNDINNKSQKFFRIINEIPVLMLILIVSIVIFKDYA